MEVVIIMSILIILSGFTAIYLTKNNLFLKLMAIVNIALVTLLINSIGLIEGNFIKVVNVYAFTSSVLLLNNYLNVHYSLPKVYRNSICCVAALHGLWGGLVLISHYRLIIFTLDEAVMCFVPAIISYIVLLGNVAVLIKKLMHKHSFTTFSDRVLLGGLILLIFMEIADLVGWIPVNWDQLVSLSILALVIIPKITLSNQGLLPLSKEQIFKNMDEMLVIVDQNDIIVDVNGSFQSNFDVNNQAIGTSAKTFFEQLPNVTENIYDELNFHKTADISFIGDSGIKTYNIRIQQIYNRLNVDIGKIMFLYDISEHKAEMNRLELIGTRDKLTNLYNRNYFEQAMVDKDQSFNLPLSIIIGDLNGLKLINDTFGHARGDDFIKKAAEVIVRTVGQRGSTFRIGGDEFCILLPKTSEQETTNVMSLIEKGIQDTFKQGIGTISLGGATKKYMNENIHDICNKADQNMYLNKQDDEKNNKNRIILSVKGWLEDTPHETANHCKRLETLALDLGDQLNLSESMLQELKTLANLHDIGKYFISKEILSKVEKLDPDDWNEIFKHPLIGYRIATSIQDLSVVAGGILSHHERWDGAGYPQGLKGEQIPYLARILSVVDAYEVMTSGRPYNKQRTVDEALSEIVSCGGTQFDPGIVDVFVKYIDEMRIEEKA